MGDNGGIYSLAGFAYQIKVFVLNVLELKNGYTLEYETIDDVALKMAADKLDEHEDDLCSIFTATSRRAIQVKKTQVTNSIAKKVVKNWILADKNNADIEQFVLVTDREVDMDAFVDLDVDEIFKEVNKIGYTEAELKQKVRDIVSMSSIQKYRNFEKNQVTKIRIF